MKDHLIDFSVSVNDKAGIDITMLADYKGKVAHYVDTETFFKSVNKESRGQIMKGHLIGFSASVSENAQTNIIMLVDCNGKVSRYVMDTKTLIKHADKYIFKESEDK